MFGAKGSMDFVLGPSPVVPKECKGMEYVARSMASISFLITSASHARLVAKSGPSSLSRAPPADLYHFVVVEIKIIRYPSYVLIRSDCKFLLK